MRERYCHICGKLISGDGLVRLVQVERRKRVEGVPRGVKFRTWLKVPVHPGCLTRDNAKVYKPVVRKSRPERKSKQNANHEH